MKKPLLLFVGLQVGTILLQAGNGEPQVADYSNKANQKTLCFEENKGQVHDQDYQSRPDVLFGGQDGNMVFHLKNNGVSYQLSRVDSWKEAEDPRANAITNGMSTHQPKVPDQVTIYRLDVSWLNANTNALIQKGNSVPSYNNYYSTTCPDGALHVNSYESVTYSNLYNGVDLMWYQKNGHLKYDYIIAPHADYKLIRLQIEGAERISINAQGELVIETPLGQIIEEAPFVTQGSRTLISKWIVRNNTVSFSIEGINPNEALIIDPAVRAWGTYYGGVGNDVAYSCPCDANGNVYLAGYTFSTGGTVIATSGSHQAAIGGNADAFLVKFDSTGVRQWSTYYGGSGFDGAYSCAVDGNGNVFITGETQTQSGNAIATVGSHQSVFGGTFDNAFLAKFDSAGMRQWGTYYGGAVATVTWSCAADGNGDVYIAGFTDTNSGTVIATPGSHQSTYGGGLYDAFLAKFNSSGVRQWGTYYGGAGYDHGYSCVVDASGNVYMAGYTETPSGNAIATFGSHQSTYGGGADAFLVKFNSSGIRQWGTYYGGPATASGNSCAVDTSGNVFLSGWTSNDTGTATATLGSHQVMHSAGFYNAFLVKFNSSGARQWGTYYGGNPGTYSYSCVADRNGNVYLTGWTACDTGTAIATPGSHQVMYGGGPLDAFLVKFNNAGVRQWGTYYGGAGEDWSYSCASDLDGNVYLCGYTDDTSSSTTIASAGAYQTFNNGVYIDAFLAKFNGCTSVNVSLSSQSNPGCYGDADGTATVTANGGSGLTYSWLPNGGTSLTALGLSAGSYTCTVTNSCGSVAQQTVVITQPPSITASQSFSICNGDSIIVGSSVYNSSGIYTDVFTAFSGCDSTVTTNLTVNPVVSTSQTISLCNGDSLIVGSSVYYNSGNYSDVFTSANGCDSTVTTNLTANTAITSSQTISICNNDSLVVGPSIYYSSGTYADVLTSVNGCDSTVTTNLTVNPAIATSQTISICSNDSLVVGPSVYYNSGTYTDVLTSVNGCDSTVTTTLTVNAAIDVTTTLNSITFTANQNAATYQWIDCNNGNQPIAGATGQSFTATVNGSYAVIVTQNACSDTSACVVILSVGTSSLSTVQTVNIYPNPSTTGEFILILDRSSALSVTDARGRVVFTAMYDAGRCNLHLEELNDGIYFLMVRDALGTATQKLIISK